MEFSKIRFLISLIVTRKENNLQEMHQGQDHQWEEVQNPIPISAPHNLRIDAGNSSQEDMIKDTKHGLLVGRLWYTYAVNPIKGDFSCTARKAE